MKKLISILLAALLIIGMLPATLITAFAAPDATTYTFSNYSAGEQYADETHILDENVTMTISKCHLNDQLRIYSSSTNNGYAIFSSAYPISAFSMNAGNKKDTLGIYGSNDGGATWTEAGTLTTNTTSYADYSLEAFADNATYKMLKLDVVGDQQLRLASITLTFADENSDEPADVVSIGDATYTSMGQALADYAEGDVLKLLADCAEDIELPCNTTLDLNGKSLTGAISGEYTLVCQDSKTADYDISDEVYGTLDVTKIDAKTTVVGAAATEETDPYAMITKDGKISFHAVGMRISGMGFKPASMGLYLKTAFKGDSMVAGEVDTFGLALQVTDPITDLEQAYLTSFESDLFNSEEAKTSCLIYNIMNTSNPDSANERNASTQIYGMAYVKFLSGSVLTGWERNRSLKEQIQRINDDWYLMSIANRASMLNVRETYKTVVEGWGLESINKDTEAEMTTDEITEAAAQLEPGEVLPDAHTLTGVISAVNTAFDSTYNNVTVTITVNDLDIQCYRLAGEGADQIGVGDTITVTGIIENYNGTREFKQGCTLDAYELAPDAEPMTPAEIVEAAYALEKGTQLPDTYTLSGMITSVDTAYNSSYSNVTVTIMVEGMSDKPIQCYRMKGTGADTIAAGDYITVSGTIKNYNGTIEFDAGCTLDAYKTEAQILAEAAALSAGASLDTDYSLTGIITSVDTAYSSTYNNVTVTMSVGDQAIKCFRLAGDGADKIAAGDTITVYGTLTNYNGSIQFAEGCKLITYSLAPEAGEVTVTIEFATDANRTSYSTTQQVWEQNGITFTNDKTNSTTIIRDNLRDDHVRLYASSTVTLAYAGMTKIEITCTSASYATVMVNSLTAAGYTATASGSVVTVTLDTAVDSITFSLTAQSRASKITVTA